MLSYNLFEFSLNYSNTTGSLWFYSKHEETNFIAVIGNNATFKSLKYKAKLLGKSVPQPVPDNDKRKRNSKKRSNCCTIKIYM